MEVKNSAQLFINAKMTYKFAILLIKTEFNLQRSNQNIKTTT
jgi:hypothetical protein